MSKKPTRQNRLSRLPVKARPASANQQARGPAPTMLRESSCKFTDTLQREWDCTLTLAGATRVDSSDFSILGVADFSILNPSRENLKELVTNRSLAFAVIWAIVYPQSRAYYDQGKFSADHQQLPEEAQEAFMEGIDGPTMSRGMEALVDSLGNFIPEIKNVLSAFLKQTEKGRARLRQEVENLIPQIQEASDQALETAVRNLKTEAAQILADLPGTLSGG